ncbi:DUF6455 family protein [Phycobacter sp. K97]|uniref:DUF6455 family protein n=1 Tax=Phycobacter sedimenti TaxID=3133977 RepID=UPI0031203096
MQPLGDALVHLRLFGLMAKTVDVDLAKAFADGKISPAEWARMVNRCRACDCAEKCERWLAVHEHASEAPDGCNNADRLRSLRGAQDATAE